MPDEPQVNPTPEAPVRPKIAPETLAEYFDSIETLFGETKTGMAKTKPLGFFITTFVFSLIPAIPFLLSKLIGHYVTTKVVSIYSFRFGLNSFWFWWLVCFAISLSMLICVSKFTGPSADEKKRWLSPPQMRFAYCYSIIDEIRRYRTNQLSHHIDAALEYFDETANSLLGISSLGSTERRGDVYVDDLGRIRHPIILERHPKWYRLRPETETIVQACREFTSKLRDRLKDKKDLNAIQSALLALAAYEYTEIPELSDSESETRFEEGTELILSFAQQVVALPPYHSEATKPTPKEKVSRKIFLAGQKLSVPFTHSNVLVTFCSWLGLMLVLFWGGFYGIMKHYQIKMDSTVMVALIGGPIATAVTAATIPRLGKGRKRQE